MEVEDHESKILGLEVFGDRGIGCAYHIEQLF